MAKATTKIERTLNGHAVVLIIGNQSFQFEERTGNEKMNSMEHAEWYQNQLKTALSKLG